MTEKSVIFDVLEESSSLAWGRIKEAWCKMAMLERWILRSLCERIRGVLSRLFKKDFLLRDLSSMYSIRAEQWR